MFITLEGIEGSGKSTQLKFVLEYLESKRIQAISTREPGGTIISEKIRDILLDKSLPAMQDDTELMLMFAARIEHVNSVILPALNEGKFVVCDRFYDASYAYQGYGRGINLERIDQLRKYSIGNLQPDITFLLDIALDVSNSRVDARGVRDRFESEKITFYENIRAGYLEIAKQQSDRVKVIDAAKPIAEVQADIKSYLDDLIKNAGSRYE